MFAEGVADYRKLRAVLLEWGYTETEIEDLTMGELLDEKVLGSKTANQFSKIPQDLSKQHFY